MQELLNSAFATPVEVSDDEQRPPSLLNSSSVWRASTSHEERTTARSRQLAGHGRPRLAAAAAPAARKHTAVESIRSSISSSGLAAGLWVRQAPTASTTDASSVGAEPTEQRLFAAAATNEAISLSPAITTVHLNAAVISCYKPPLQFIQSRRDRSGVSIGREWERAGAWWMRVAEGAVVLRFHEAPAAQQQH